MLRRQNVSGALICIGGPALTYYVIPTDEELFQRYNPELKKRSLERRYETEKGFDDFVNKLKEQSKSKQSSKTRSPDYQSTSLNRLADQSTQYGLCKRRRLGERNRLSSRKA